MRYFKSFFITIFIFNLFIIFIFSSQSTSAETYTCKRDGECFGSYDSIQSPIPPYLNYCKDSCPSDYQCVLFNSNAGCIDQTRNATNNTNMPQLQIPDLNVKFSPKVCKTENGQTICSIAWIGEYIAGIYKYAIGIVGILAAVVLMIGGVMWIIAGGSATMIGEAKAWIGASLTGLVIALCSYLILYQINPALTVFGPLGITQVKKIETPVVGARLCKRDISCDGNWEPADEKFCNKALTADGTICCCVKPIAACQPVASGNCSVANLLNVFSEQAGQASVICNGESANGTLLESTTDKCADGKSVSWGLFQINITVHTINGLNCPSAFSGGPYTASNHNCRVTDLALYEQCVNAAKDPDINKQKAYEISGTGLNWNPWGFYTKTCKSYF